MPRVLRTVIPRIKKSLRDRGLVTSICRSFLLPVHLFKEHRAAKALRPHVVISEFDRKHGVDTEGGFEGWTYLSDLDIPSPNWIEGNDYLAIGPERFRSALESFNVRFENFTFIDFGSGKGRALLLASGYPFRRILGLEFSPELHRIAQENIRRFNFEAQKCSDIESLNVDFTDYELPPEPSVLFFFNPCRERVLTDVLTRIGRSLRLSPRPVYIAYVAHTPQQQSLFVSAVFLEKILDNAEFKFSLYRACL